MKIHQPPTAIRGRDKRLQQSRNFLRTKGTNNGEFITKYLAPNKNRGGKAYRKEKYIEGNLRLPQATSLHYQREEFKGGTLCRKNEEWGEGELKR